MIRVNRTFPAPKSLATEATKASGKYNCPDVVAQLKHDFYDKCYICGIKGLQDPEVEHLLPHKNGAFPERKFDWENLFLSCGHCNGIKSRSKYDNGIIDCCKQDPEELISFRLIEGNVDVKAKDSNDELSNITATLVYEVFNLKNTGIRISASDHRFQELCKEMNKLYSNLDALKQNPDSKVVQRKLKGILSRESAFAAFKRNYIRENQDQFPQLKDYIA